MEERRREGKKGRNDSLCVWFLCRGSSIVRRASAVHMVIAIVFIARLSPFTRFRISHIFQKEFSHLWIGRCVYSFFSNGFASEIYLFVQLTNWSCYQIVQWQLDTIHWLRVQTNVEFIEFRHLARTRKLNILYFLRKLTFAVSLFVNDLSLIEDYYDEI